MSRLAGSPNKPVSRKLPVVASPRLAMPLGSSLTVAWKPLAEIDRKEWAGLSERTLEANVFLEPAFACAALEHLSAAKIYALEVRDEERLVGILPGRVEGVAAARPVPAFVAWTHPFAPFSAPLIDREEPAEVLAAMLHGLPSLPGAPRLAILPETHEDGAFGRLCAALLSSQARVLQRFDRHARAALKPDEWHPMASVSSGKLKELRRQRRRLDETGRLTREMVTAPEAMLRSALEFLSLEARGWKGRADTAAILHPNETQFFANAVVALAEEGKARIDFLRLNGTAIASTVTLFSGDRAWFWKTAYDEAFARFSPGVQLALDITESLGGDSRIALVDSCATADHPMIDRLWHGRINVADWFIPLGGSTAFAAAVAAERVRRAVVGGVRGMRNRVRG